MLRKACIIDGITFWHMPTGGVTLGHKPDSTPLSVGDKERASGLYILGKPRMGKSWLIVNMILQDIENGHGVFFLDPHGDAIDDLLSRTNTDVLVFDPEDETYSFGINLLECPNIDSVPARNETFSKAKGVFDKLWKHTFEDKPWLQLILQNTIYAFIETPGLTLLELPIFYRNRDFRDYVVDNIRYNWQVRDYWQRTFAAKSVHDQNEQMEAAQTRAEIMLAHPCVSDIVGQTHTTIDFARILAGDKIVLVKLSNRLSYEAKTIIGTILVSELLHAIERRSAHKREQFCIYIDEFQHFASYQDFPVLITQAPKYGVATTLAHHERYGQLAGQPEIMGATAAIANKVLFQITARDAHELAPEFAEAPATETRYEEGYIISREPVWDLLRWHDNSTIREFVNRYIRPMKERLEDIRGESEAERLIRTDYLDEANMFRLSERIEAVDRIEANYDRMRGALSSAGRLTSEAGKHTKKVLSLTEEATSLRLTFRDLNKFLTAVMEGALAPGQQGFGRFLIDRIAGLSSVAEAEKQILEIYVALAYGDPYTRLVCPFSFAKKHSLFTGFVSVNEMISRVQYSRGVEKYKEQSRSYMLERLKTLDRDIRDKERWIADYEVIHSALAPFGFDKEYKEGVDYLAYYKNEREDLAQNFDAKLEEGVRNFGRSYDADRLRKEVAPKDFTTQVGDGEKGRVMRACLQELGATGKKALQIIEEFVDFCNLLAAPQNHITKRSGQFAAKQVNIRTEQDMTNEMARNLTNLPKYTAYAKILQDEGARVWIGKIKTLELGATTAGADTQQTFDHVEMRWKVQEEIAERHKRLMGNITGDNEPPPAVY